MPKITTTQGWELLACFKDGSLDFVKLKDIKESNIIKVAEYTLACFKDGSLNWVKLKDIKESNISKVAEYAVANCLVEEPAFKWCVLQVLCQQNCIISKVKSCTEHLTRHFFHSACLHMLCQ